MSEHCAGSSRASDSEIVTALPVPMRNPELVRLPGRTMIVLLPMLAICCWMRCFAPEPMAAVAITAATPITMPSMVSAERSLLTCSARKAMRMEERKCFMVEPPRARGNSQH